MQQGLFAENDWGQLALAIGAIGVIIGAFLKHLNRRDDLFGGTIKEINDRNLAHHSKLAEETNERSQALRDCVNENNRLIGRACNTLDRHDAILAEFERQRKVRSET